MLRSSAFIPLTEAGYIKRQLKATYQAQKRGGRGISGMTRKEEDIVQEMFVGSTHDYVLFVTDKGRLFRIKGYTIAEGSRTSKGTNIVNLLQLAEGEKVTNMLCQSKDTANEGGFVTMVTKQGLIERTPLEQYANIRKSGLIGIALNEGDALAWTRLTSGHDMLIVATRKRDRGPSASMRRMPVPWAAAATACARHQAGRGRRGRGCLHLP